MNDRFRFRVWCKNNKEWEKDIVSIDNKGFYNVNNTLVTNQDPKNHIINFCIGLKDKNGKLIYEGDILQVQLEDHSIFGKKNPITYWTVEHKDFRNESGYMVYGIDRRWHNILTKNRIFNSNATVIGNIYENPELLESEK